MVCGEADVRTPASCTAISVQWMQELVLSVHQDIMGQTAPFVQVTVYLAYASKQMDLV